MTDAFNRETITRKELDSKLRDLVKASKTRNLVGVAMYSSNNPDSGFAWDTDFYGKGMKDDLFGFLMDKSLTSRIVDVRTKEIMGLLYLHITLFSQDEKPLKRTNIDGKTMGFLEKARYVP